MWSLIVEEPDWIMKTSWSRTEVPISIKVSLLANLLTVAGAAPTPSLSIINY